MKCIPACWREEGSVMQMLERRLTQVVSVNVKPAVASAMTRC